MPDAGVAKDRPSGNGQQHGRDQPGAEEVAPDPGGDRRRAGLLAVPPALHVLGGAEVGPQGLPVPVPPHQEPENHRQPHHEQHELGCRARNFTQLGPDDPVTVGGHGGDGVRVQDGADERRHPRGEQRGSGQGEDGPDPRPEAGASAEYAIGEQAAQQQEDDLRQPSPHLVQVADREAFEGETQQADLAHGRLGLHELGDVPLHRVEEEQDRRLTPHAVGGQHHGQAAIHRRIPPSRLFRT
ncbi:hypothetical protein SBADM41S_04523 [Streptomyces badius]